MSPKASDLRSLPVEHPLKVLKRAGVRQDPLWAIRWLNHFHRQENWGKIMTKDGPSNQENSPHKGYEINIHPESDEDWAQARAQQGGQSVADAENVFWRPEEK
jgi:hypothetical protein